MEEAAGVDTPPGRLCGVLKSNNGVKVGMDGRRCGCRRKLWRRPGSPTKEGEADIGTFEGEAVMGAFSFRSCELLSRRGASPHDHCPGLRFESASGAPG
jgi:hypothetical protein